jgi:hypothetical protein
MLQVIPSDNLPVSNTPGSGGTQVFQVGNMLQVVPGGSMSPAPSQPVVMMQATVAVPPPPPTPPQPSGQTHGTAEVSVGHSPIASSPIAKVGSCYVFSSSDGCCLWNRLSCFECSKYILTH